MAKRFVDTPAPNVPDKARKSSSLMGQRVNLAYEVSERSIRGFALTLRFLTRSRAFRETVLRSLCLLAISTLLLPQFALSFAGPLGSARKLIASQKLTSPNARAPLPYRFGNRPSVLERFSESASKISGAAFDLTEPHDLPSDFKRPEEYSSFTTRLTTLIRRVGMELGLAGPREREIAANPSVSVPSSVEFDFDGDNVADFARWQPSTGEWKIKNSNGGSYSTDTLGDSNSLITPGDFNGDGTTDVAIFKAGTWTIHPSGGSSYTFSYGAAGDKPVVGDYDGDGTSDVSVFRPSNGTWYIYKSGTSTSTSVSFGVGSDIPVQGDYDGDGKTDIAVWRPVGGVWHILGSTAGYYGYSWGASPDIPVPEDYDGDGKTDYAVWRPDSGTWYVVKSSNLSQTYVASWGNYGDQPAPADYDGDGKAEMTVWRPKTGTWFAYDSCNYDSSCGGGATYFTETLGVAGDTPVAAAYLKKSGAFIQEYDFSQTRLSPKNATGGTNLYSRNFSWGTTLVSLPGRAGLDAGIGVGYNSLVWIKDPSNSTMVFDPDGSNVAPGFNFGFPEIEPVYYDPNTQKYSYLMVTPSGSRIEFRQAAAKNEYETADSSYLLLKTVNAEDPNDPVGSFEITVTDTNGTVMTYEWKANAYRLREIKDRNGNYITVSHNEYGLLEWVKDTLGRIINVNYDSSLRLTSITQQWKDSNGAGSAVTRTYATFEYSDITVNPSFTALAIYGPSNGTVKVLSKIIYGTSASNLGDTRFEYNTFGQVEKVRNFAADGHELNYTATNLDTPGTGLTDVPRLTQTRTWVENFNLDGSGNEQEVVVNNSLTTSQTWNLPGSISETGTEIQVSMTGHPNGHISKMLVGETGWEEGLPLASADWVDVSSTSTRKRWTWNSWTQDDTSKSFMVNPRVEESRVGDDENGNVLKTALTYEMESGNISKFGLVNEVTLSDIGASKDLKKVEIEYELGSSYLSRRIIGLKKQVITSGDENSNLVEVGKVTYAYDEGDFSDTSLEQNVSPTFHDSAYGSSFIVGRGNLTSVTRWDIDYPMSSSAAVTSEVRYNTAGSVVARIDPLDRLIRIDYTDRFNDSPSDKGTYAYPTSLTDSEGNSSDVMYRFDFGANVWAASPDPGGNTSIYGKETSREFDSLGRLTRETLENNGAYTRYEYPANQVQSVSYAVLNDGGNGIDSSDEVLSETLRDGAGRTLMARSVHLDSYGGYSGAVTQYDKLGRAVGSTVLTEINQNWIPSGDDDRGTVGSGNPIWLWNTVELDWKGRPLKAYNTDGTYKQFSYSGCGCAGGEVTTAESELVPRDDQPTVNARRKKKTYTDSLGRVFKEEVFKWDGSLYTRTQATFDGRDNPLTIVQEDHSVDPVVSRTSSISYDGHGRTKTRHDPINESGTETTWIYNEDDSVQQIIDPRGAITSFTYGDDRGLVTQISYDPPSTQPTYTTIPDTANVAFTYDSAGNRLSMTDGSGSTSYVYDDLSQLTSETKTFTGLTGNYAISYSYYLSGKLKTVTDPFSNSVHYNDDRSGRTTSVTDGSSLTYAENIEYRAFGAPKQIEYGSSDSSVISYEFDDRQRIESYQATSSVLSEGFVRKAEYEYFADGSLKKADNLLDDSFDQDFSYDHLGRLKSNVFGTSIDNEEEEVTTYSQTFSYNGFGEMTTRDTTLWGEQGGFFGATYTNGRKDSSSPVWIYDASGNFVDATTSSTKYDRNQFDAAGRQVKSEKGYFQGAVQQTSFDRTLEIDSVFDGDGRKVKRVESHTSQQIWPQGQPLYEWDKTEYFLYSSVLGKVLSEVKEDGTKKITYIYSGSGILAHSMGSVHWRHQDLLTGSYQDIAANGNKGFGVDPPLSGEIGVFGEFVPTVDPDDSAEIGGALAPLSYSFGSEVQDAWQCEYNYSRIPCYLFGILTQSGEYRYWVHTRGDERHGFNTHDVRSIIMRTTRVDYKICPESNPNCNAAWDRGPESQFTLFTYNLTGLTLFQDRRDHNYFDSSKYDNCLADIIISLFLTYKTLSKTFSRQMTRAVVELGEAADNFSLSVAQTAYLLATGVHESKGFTDFVEDPNGKNATTYFEGKYGSTTKVGKDLGNKNPGDGSRFIGRGIIQVTGRRNYEWVKNTFPDYDVIANPGILATNLDLSANVAAIGITSGKFGNPLSDYISSSGIDFMSARNSVNSRDFRDRAKIANLATDYLRRLRACH